MYFCNIVASDHETLILVKNNPNKKIKRKMELWFHEKLPKNVLDVSLLQPTKCFAEVAMITTRRVVDVHGRQRVEVYQVLVLLIHADSGWSSH